MSERPVNSNPKVVRKGVRETFALYPKGCRKTCLNGVRKTSVPYCKGIRQTGVLYRKGMRKNRGYERDLWVCMCSGYERDSCV